MVTSYLIFIHVIASIIGINIIVHNGSNKVISNKLTKIQLYGWYSVEMEDKL